MTLDEREAVTRIARVWLNEAKLHENEAAYSDDIAFEEIAMHAEAARVYRRCADDILGGLKEKKEEPKC